MRPEKAGILTIAYHFDPEKAVGAIRPQRFHRYLCELGYDSRVIAAQVNPNENAPGVFHVPDVTQELWDRRAADRKTGRDPVSLPLSAQVERLMRKTFLSGHGGLNWSRNAADYAKKLVRNDKSLTTVISSFPATGTHLAAMRLAKDTGVRWIADFRDPFSSHTPALTQWSQRHLERLIIRYADATIANTKAVAEIWRERYKWAASKIHLIWNAYDPDNEVKAMPIPPRDDRHIVHTGNLYEGRNANVVIAALARLRERSAPGAGKIRIVLTGLVAEQTGVDEPLYERAASEGWLEVNRTSIAKRHALRLAQEADGLLLLQPQSVNQVPAKLFEYASIGRPILALAPPGSSIEWILQRSGLPYVCLHPNDCYETADDKVMRFLELPNTPTNANEWFRRTFNARLQTDELVKIIDTVNERLPIHR
jgi:hypothetical protein